MSGDVQHSGTSTAAAVLGRAASAARDQRLAEARLMDAACAWADQHPAESLADAAFAAGAPEFGDRALALAGSHVPLVTEFAVTELAARCGRSTGSGRAFLGEALFTRHLLPRLWDRVQEGAVDGWRARLVARMCLGKDLTPEAAGFVDRHVAPVAQTIGTTQLGRLVEEGLLRFMPEQAEADRQAALEHRHFTVHGTGRPGAPGSTTGTVDATGTFDLPDGLLIRDAVADEADRLRALGADQAPGPLSATALANLVARGSDTGSAQGVLDLTADPAHDLRAEGPTTRPRRARRRYLLHLHLTDLALAGHRDGSVARVEETRAPVTADTIRDWLSADDAHVTVLPVLDLAEAIHTGAYEAPARLQAQVALTHLSCVFPWCTRGARVCDHDHAIEHDPGGGGGGPTCSCNVAPLCRSHHRLKTHGHGRTRWRLDPAGPGAWLWTSPQAQHYLRDHRGTHALGPPGPREPAHRDPDPPDG